MIVSTKYKDGDVLFALLPEVEEVPFSSNSFNRFFADHKRAMVCRARVVGIARKGVPRAPKAVAMDLVIAKLTKDDIVVGATGDHIGPKIPNVGSHMVGMVV